MKRENFKKIIKLRSEFIVDKRKGNYILPAGDATLLDYLKTLVESQMKIDHLGIKADGNLCFCDKGDWNPETKEFDDYILYPPFENNETCSYDKMEQRINRLTYELLH